MHVIVRFEPKAGCAMPLREALRQLGAHSRREAGCVRFEIFEAVRAPIVLAIHSEWIDEAAFESHAAMGHTQHFIATVTPLLTHAVQGLRLRSLSDPTTTT